MALSAPSQSKIPTKTHNSMSPGLSVLPPLRLGRAGTRRAVPPVSAEKPVRPPAETIVWWWRWRGV
jgi:hypothetical protein